MRRLGTACLLLGLSTPAFAAEPPAAEEPPSIPWYRWLFLGERAKPVPPPPAARPSAPAARPGVPRESARDLAAKQLAEEQRVYLKRLEAISRIRLAAGEQNDDAMLKKADELELQAEQIFKQRTTRLTSLVDRDDRATLERGRDDRPATADRTMPRRPTTGGRNR